MPLCPILKRIWKIHWPLRSWDVYGRPPGAGLAYDNASDSLTIPLLRNGTGATLTLRATLPAANFGSLESRFTDLRHEIRASYTLETVSTQELGGTGELTPEQERQQEVLKLAIEMDETQQRIQRSLDVSEVTETITTLETEAWSLPSKLRAEVLGCTKPLAVIPGSRVTTQGARYRGAMRQGGPAFRALPLIPIEIVRGVIYGLPTETGPYNYCGVKFE